MKLQLIKVLQQEVENDGVFFFLYQEAGRQTGRCVEQSAIEILLLERIIFHFNLTKYIYVFSIKPF